MSIQAASDKLLEFAERHAEHIAKQWWQHIKRNQRVPSYHSLPEIEAIKPAVSFYKNLKYLYNSDDVYQATEKHFTKYAADRYADGIPLQEVIYALVMMRRHLWLYAEFQSLFTTSLDMYQSIAAINKTVAITDYATHIIIREYNSLASRTEK